VQRSTSPLAGARRHSRVSCNHTDYRLRPGAFRVGGNQVANGPVLAQVDLDPDGCVMPGGRAPTAGRSGHSALTSTPASRRLVETWSRLVDSVAVSASHVLPERLGHWLEARTFYDALAACAAARLGRVIAMLPNQRGSAGPRSSRRPWHTSTIARTPDKQHRGSPLSSTSHRSARRRRASRTSARGAWRSSASRCS
jgi:hypothetical protein